MKIITIKKIKELRQQKEVLILVVSLLLIILTPILTPDNLAIKKEILESILLFIFSFIALIAAYFNEKRINRKKAQADEVLNYLGTINLQFAHARSIFEDVKRFPESKAEFKMLLGSLAEKALGINNADWLIFRIVDSSNRKTLIEYTQARGGKIIPEKNKIKTRDLLENSHTREFVVLDSSQENLGIKTFCILSSKEINGNQQALMGVIVNNLSLYYLLFVSIFHKK